MLHRYWIKFEVTDEATCKRVHAHGVLMGCGVTWFTVEDALHLVRERMFRGAALPPVAELIEDVDLSTLDRNHVLPNALPPVWRGVWFPMGFAEPPRIRDARTDC